MLNKNTDGIKKIKKFVTGQKKSGLINRHQPARLRVDGIIRQKNTPLRNNFIKKSFRVSYTSYVVPYNNQKQNNFAFEKLFKKLYASRKVPLVAIVIALAIAFSGGVWVALNTTKTAAVDLSATNTQSGNNSVTLESGLASNTTVTNDVLFNTPIEYLQNYLATTAQPDIIKNRTDQLTQFLKDRNSPLADEAETIAEQPHWKIILAIAFAESTLGKHCYEFNCSGIGGAQIKTYASSKQWIVDFNRLLEKRYKDDTLEQMCGVYVQPCTSNWLLATKQILNGLEEKGIE